MSGSSAAARPARQPVGGPGRFLAGAAFTLAIVVIAATAAWPVYAAPVFLVVLAAGAAIGAAVAVCAQRFGWGGWIVAAILIGALFAVGVVVAAPARLSDIAQLPLAFGDVLTGAVFGWKDLLTVDLPVGTYRNLLVPALVVFLGGTCAMLLLSWRRDARAYAAVPVGLAMVGFGLLFGRTTVSETLVLGPVALPAPVETAVGASALTAALLWLVWRGRAQRAGALERAGRARVTRRAASGSAARAWTAAGMLALAVIVAVAVVPLGAQGLNRDVLRSLTAPEIDLSAEISPLAAYRASFDDERYDDVLFTVDVEEGEVDRIRIATLDGYDGEVFRTEPETRFVRVPSTRAAEPGESAALEIGIADLGSVWMPTAGDLVEVAFVGERASALADGFYYSADDAAGVQTAGGGLRAGDGYRLVASVAETVDPAAMTAPGTTPAVEAPESLRTWVEEHRTGSDGAALVGLIDLLRDRGYLSHGLTEPEAGSRWVEDLVDYRFQPAAAGHSLARIDQMFTRLLQRESDPQAVAADNFVAAVGDDEQFAVAAALIAEELGFPARVVVGTRLQSDDASASVCDDGVCTAGDLAAWVEVQTDTGAWVPMDATPQHTRSPNLDTTEQRDPENVTDVRPDAVEEVVPPDPTQQDDAAARDDEDRTGLDLAWLWPILRTTSIVLLIALLLLGPFAAVIAAKAARRRGRRRAATPAERIAGGWDEIVDAAADARREAPGARTRAEAAELWELPDGGRIAAAADAATFSGRGATPDEAESFWRDVDARRRALRTERGVWRALAASVSLRSFMRQAAPAGGRRRRLAERGERGSPRRARTAP